jgi:HEPN domain-containing protein
MNPLTLEWLNKAEADWRSANWELRAPSNVNYDAVCFFAQQRAEKHLKARLQEAGIRFSKTHDLEALLELCLAVEPGWTVLREAARALTDYAADFRYPGSSAVEAEAREALQQCGRVRAAAREGLGIQSDEP